MRLFSGAYSIKWMMIGVTNRHDFTSFARRTPSGTFTDSTLQQFREMVQLNQPGSEMIVKNDVFCSKHVFQNSLRRFRSDKKQDQSREIRDTVRLSSLWDSQIRLTNENVFEEIFFINRPLISMGAKIDFVYVDDTSCANEFSLPLISVLYRSDSGSVHTVSWGILKPEQQSLSPISSHSFSNGIQR